MLRPYLERIGLELEPTLTADAASLRRLQLAHMLHVPFENLDIALGRPIRLGLTTLYDKIVTHRRGGFCYELNGLFAWMLDDLGFEVTYLSASDYHPPASGQGAGSYGLDYDHLALLVRCPADPAPEVRWLVDVGWGDTFRIPLRADAEGEQDGGLKTYRITTNPPEAPGAVGRRQLWERHTNTEGYSSSGVWERQYAFTTQPRAFPDFEPMCRYHQTSPESIFTRKQICTLATPEGRISLEDGRLLITRRGAREERMVAPEEKEGLLRELFGIDLADPMGGPAANTHA
jgi:N-hydroxyarylamine O-acetyltransferase